jgi:hypothetical protein
MDISLPQKINLTIIPGVQSESLQPLLWSAIKTLRGTDWQVQRYLRTIKKPL